MPFSLSPSVALVLMLDIKVFFLEIRPIVANLLAAAALLLPALANPFHSFKLAWRVFGLT